MEKNEIVPELLGILRAYRQAASGAHTSRRGYFTDRLMQAVARESLGDALEYLHLRAGVSAEHLPATVTVAQTRLLADEPAALIGLEWLRAYTRLAGSLAMMSNDNYRLACGDGLPPAPNLAQAAIDYSLPIPQYQVAATAKLLSPLAHGDDHKTGNATLFRRRSVIYPGGGVVQVPFYAGNALRGQLRDLLAADFLTRLGFTTRTHELAKWFFSALYSGGVLQESGAETQKIMTQLNPTEGHRRVRTMLPHLSLLGMSVGNQVLSGRFDMGDLRPECREWGYDAPPAQRMLDWEYLTRRDDREVKDDDHEGMIAITEVLQAGVVLRGGLDVHPHATALERSVLAHGLELLEGAGRLGAQNRSGLGKVALRWGTGTEGGWERYGGEGCYVPVPEQMQDEQIWAEVDGTGYRRWLDENRDDVSGWLHEVGAVTTLGALA